MNRVAHGFFIALISTLITLAAIAQQPQTVPADDNTTMVINDLRALSRIAQFADNLNDSRQVLLAITDNDIRTLRGPRDDGSYKWASLQREEGGRVKDQKAIEYVYTEKELRNVTITGANAYRIEISVPQKRNLISANNRVWVRNIVVDSTGFDGKTVHHEIAVNAWVNPGDSNGVPLPEIGKSVKVTAELGVESGKNQAVADIALVQAKLVDDATSPYFPVVKRLLLIRELSTPRDINRGQLKNAIDEALLASPGELEKRAVEQARIAEERKVAKGAINIGDATPDVVSELTSISRMLTGTLQEQSDARAKLQALIERLTPKSQQ